MHRLTFWVHVCLTIAYMSIYIGMVVVMILPPIDYHQEYIFGLFTVPLELASFWTTLAGVLIAKIWVDCKHIKGLSFYDMFGVKLNDMLFAFSILLTPMAFTYVLLA